MTNRINLEEKVSNLTGPTRRWVFGTHCGNPRIAWDCLTDTAVWIRTTHIGTMPHVDRAATEEEKECYLERLWVAYRDETVRAAHYAALELLDRCQFETGGLLSVGAGLLERARRRLEASEREFMALWTGC